MTHAAPTVSTVVPLYNAASTIEATLRSIQAQTLESWEAIVVNDGSTDDGPAIVERMAEMDRRIRLVHQDNAGVARARNAALDRARGEYIHCLDSDDLLEPHAYETLVEAERASGLGGAVGSVRISDASGAELHRTCIPAYSIGLWDMVFRWSTWTGAHIVRRCFYEGVRFDPRFPPFEDRDCWIRLAERGVRWRCAPHVVASYVIRPGSLSKHCYTHFRSIQGALSELHGRHQRREPINTLPDLTEERLRRLLGEHALACMTRAVVLEGVEGVEAAAAEFAVSMGEKSISPERAAQAVRFAVIYGLGEAPSNDETALLRWAPAVHAWWERCERMGWGAPGFAERAWTELGLLLVSAEDVCERILDRCDGAPEILVIGFGQNGRALARAARRRGVRVCVRDDRYPTGLPVGDPDGEGVACEPMEAPVAPGRPVALSPLNDSGLLPRFAATGRLIRWIECRDELVERVPSGAIPAGAVEEMSKVEAERTVASLR